MWAPHGASDAIDGSSSFPGAMASLQNLIPDPSTTDLWQCRPAATALSTFLGFTSPTGVTCRLVVGTYLYGMVSTGRFANHDEPFAYDLVANLFITITGVTAGNTPSTPSTTGAWQPPHMELIASKVICTHPGFPGGAQAFGVLDVSNPAAPVWTATNTTTNILPSVPVWVANFNGRAYYLVNPAGQQPAAYISNINDPINCNGSGSNFTPILTFDDNTALTCAVGLPLENQLGGIVQSLMVFKGVTNIYQITGDPFLPITTGASAVVTSNLSKNSLNVATGTFAPNSACSTTKGIMFMAPDGIRLIDFMARVSDPIGKAGAGVTVPFFNAGTPSRSCAAFNGGVYRIQVTNSNAGNTSQQWWYDTVRDIWSGPHTQPMSLIDAYVNTFIVTFQGVAALYQSDQVQSSASSFVENGTPLTYTFTTVMLPDTDQMAEVAVIETTVHMALTTYSVTAYSYDQNAAVLAGPITIFNPGAGTIWGAFNWGQASWGGSSAGALYPRQIAWTQPLVFRRMRLSVQGQCVAGIQIGRVHLRYQVLGYLQM